MELRQLRYFVTVAQERHFGRAAARLRIATPSLSQQIRALERDLHAVLLDRDPRGVVPTPAGQVLLEHARALLARADRAAADVRAADRCPPHPVTIRLGVGVECVLGDVLADLVRDVDPPVSIATSQSGDAVQAVRDGRADAAVVWSGSGQERDLTRYALDDVPLLLALPATHPLAAAPTVRVADVAAEPIVAFPRALEPGWWDRLAGTFGPAQRFVEPVLMSGAGALLGAVAAGHGLAVVPEAVVRRMPGAAIITRPLDPSLTLTLELAWRDPRDAALERLAGRLAAPRSEAAGVAPDAPVTLVR
jgi:DNA-binding transcriptional LysR family regulator